jgi:hypothetical protein
MRSISIVVAVNDESVLRACLLASPAISEVNDVILKRGFRSAGLAYNEGLAEIRTELAVFVHQDVYLPEGWWDCLERQVGQLAAINPNWGVCGVFGITTTGEEVGHTYSTGLGGVLGCSSAQPRVVRALDEMLLVVRRLSGLHFDHRLPGFHLYGTDICLEAERHGIKCYALSAFCIHNSNSIVALPVAYWRAYAFMRRKWRHRLPVRTPCMTLSRSPWPALRYLLATLPASWKDRYHIRKRCQDPATLYSNLIRAGRHEEHR